MLFTDGTILSIPELREHDNLVLEVTSTESIELGSKLAIAQREVGYELSSFLMSSGVGIGLGRVVVTDQLRDLLAAHTLASVYRDAYNTNLNDRYLGRWKEFAKASERGLLRFLQNGVGIASVAVPRAERPGISTEGSGILPAGVYYVQIVWQHMAGNIGERSEPVFVEVAAGSMTITPPVALVNAAGWHVFIGQQEDGLKRQNEAPISAGVNWTQAAALRDDLDGPDTSGPDYYVRNSGQVNRG